MSKLTSPASGLELTSSLRGFLYLTAALCGAAVLVVEILGAKMLSPYFGTSHFVWTAQIAVTLLSLAGGYAFGGWLVDRSPKLHRLYFCILVAAAYLGASVPLCRPVAEQCLQLKLAMGSLLASLFLFFVPLSLLATVGPFLVRVMTASVNVVGRQVGRLSALSTFGSVLGTVLIGYGLIPFLPNSITMFSTAAVLMALAATYFLGFSRANGKRLAVALLMGVGLGGGALGIKLDGKQVTDQMTEVERRNSNFGLMQVFKDNARPRLYYLNDYLTQNGYDTDRKQSFYAFTYMLHALSHAYTEKIETALCIGMGIGIVPMQLAREGVRVDVVEINPAVVPLAQRYFDFDPSSVSLFLDDGRHFLNDCTNRYDAILLDAFLGDSSPSHLMTREAFAAMRSVLKPGGVLVINSFADLERGWDFYGASLEKTLLAAFRSVKIHTSRNGGSGNVYYAASDRSSFEFLHQPSWETAHPDVQATMRSALVNVVGSDLTHGRVLTDDFNPVEFYDAANRERTRKYLAVSMMRPKN